MLTHIDRRYLDQVWPAVAPMLAQAVEKNQGEGDLSQLRAQIAYGGAELLVWSVDDEVRGAVTVEFKQYPNYRAAHIAYMGGEHHAEYLDEFKAWARVQGASVLECLCGASHERLFHRYGWQTTYTMMRQSL
jgi:hypothetical protein